MGIAVGSGGGGARGTQEHSDVLRELDELWLHLMLSGSMKQLKRDAVLSIDFLMNGNDSLSFRLLSWVPTFCLLPFLLLLVFVFVCSFTVSTDDAATEL